MLLFHRMFHSKTAPQSNLYDGGESSSLDVGIPVIPSGDGSPDYAFIGNGAGPPEMIQREWKDITTEFFGCVKELKLGELIHDNMFGLFDAMSAIEMMDPKMDAGMCCNKEATPLNFQTAVEVSVVEQANLPGRAEWKLIGCILILGR